MLGKEAEVAFSLEALQQHRTGCTLLPSRICGSPGFHNPAALTFYNSTRALAVYPHLSPSPPAPCSPDKQD